MFENQIKEAISKVTKVKKQEIFLKVPKPEFGDYAFPCFMLAKTKKKNPKEIVKDLSIKLKKQLKGIEIKPAGGYINFFVNKEKFSQQVIKQIQKEKIKYGSSKEGKNKKIVIDFSSPNIAKPFNIGHLRSTIIGYSLYKIFNHLGYKSVGINHLGDWGTQFGQLITAYKKWGKESKLKKEPIKYLLDIYVKFNKESTNKEELYDKAKEEFKKLEQGDKQNTLLWKKFKDLSLKEFSKIYKILNIHFDSYAGESFYNNQLEKTINLLEKKGITKTSEGALIIPVGNMPPCILKKSDGASTYHTRELAALFYRNSKYNPEKILYIVGSEQKLHFQQVFKALNIAGFNWYNHCIHIPFGLIRLEEGKLSTRAGRVIFMEQVIEKGIILAEKIIQKKNPKLKNKDKVAKDIAIGAIIYGDLSNDRILNIRFDWNKILAFEGNSGPYLQYSLVRANSILKKLKSKTSGKINFKNLHEKEYLLIKELSLFPEIIKRAARNFKPNIIANYTYSIARLFNDFYEYCPVIKAKAEEKSRRVAIVKATKQVLENCFNLLLIPPLQEM